MSTKRKLKRKAERARQIEPLSTFHRHPLRKMSEILLEYAQPLFEIIDEDDLNQFTLAVQVAILCWNVSLLPPDEQQQFLDSAGERVDIHRLPQYSKIKQALQGIMNILIERRKTLYPNEKRLVMDFQIVDEPDQHRLFVVSSPLSSSTY